MTTRTTPVTLRRRIANEEITAITQKGIMAGRSVTPLAKLPGVDAPFKSIKPNELLADASFAERSITSGLKEAGLNDAVEATGLPAPVLLSTAVNAFLKDGKDIELSKKIGDVVGMRFAGLTATEHYTLFIAAIISGYNQLLSLITDFANALNSTIPAAAGLSAAQTVMSWAMTALYGLYYVFNIIRNTVSLAFLLQGRKWREELVASKNPLEALDKKLADRIRDKTINMDIPDLHELALESGVKWLEKLSKADTELGKILGGRDTKEAFRQLVERDPTIITDQIGKSKIHPDKTNINHILTLYGTYVLEQNESAKFEAACARQLGSKIIEAIKAGDNDKIKEAVNYKDSLVLIGKIAIAAISLTALIVGTIFTGGAPLAVLLILAAVGGVGLILLGDVKLLAEHLTTSEFKNRDRIFTILSLVASILTVAALVTLTVLTGGTAFLVGLVLASIWVGINIYTTGKLWQFDHRKWDALKEVDPETFKKFINTGPTQEQITAIKAKMSVEHRKLLEDGMSIDGLIAKLHQEREDYHARVRKAIKD
jgi:hypothetical protein